MSALQVRGENVDLVIVVEEAHHVLYRQEHRAKETVMNMLLRQCRELGIGMIIVDLPGTCCLTLARR